MPPKKPTHIKTVPSDAPTKQRRTKPPKVDNREIATKQDFEGLSETDIYNLRKTKKPPGLATLGQEYAQPGDNARYLRYAMASLDLPPINLDDPEQVKQRIQDYFDFCAENDRKPSMVGMANWLGVNRETLNEWKKGVVRENTHTAIIKRACGMLEEMMVDYFQNGKLNPASGIFLMKNMFGYKDVQDVVVTPNNPLGDAEVTPQLADKYLDIVEVQD